MSTYFGPDVNRRNHTRIVEINLLENLARLTINELREKITTNMKYTKIREKTYNNSLCVYEKVKVSMSL